MTEPSLLVVSRASDSTGGRLEAAAAVPGRPIHSIAVLPRAIYDPVPAGRLGVLYRIANRLHVTTRPSTVRDHLILEPGDPWSEREGREALRVLRGLDFLEPVTLSAEPLGDSVAVSVETRDVWSTRAEFNLESASGQSAGSVSFSESNLLGLGKAVEVSYRRDPTGISRLASWTDPALAGSHVQLRLAAGSGSAGLTNAVAVGVPFWAEDAPYTAMASWSRTTSTGRLFERGTVGAEFDQRREEVRLAWGRGVRSDGLVRRLVWSFDALERRLGASRLQPGVSDEFVGEAEALRIRRLGVELKLWRPGYVERRRVDRLTGIEDFDLGPMASLTAGFSPQVLGSTADESYLRFALDAGAATPLGFGWVRSAMATRFRWNAEELIRTIDARWINQSLPSHTVVGAAWGAWGQRVARDWQVVVGGLNGLRAYPVHALAGRQVWRFNVEDRWLLRRDYLRTVDVGLAGFWDGGRAWGAGAFGSGWHHDAGIGLRLALPHLSSNQLVRLDLAWPLTPLRSGRRDPVLSFGSNQAF